MADRSTPLILDALRRAAAEPAGLPLFSSRARPGLFGTTAAGKQAAARCRELALLRAVSGETNGKNTQEAYALSDAGWTLLFQESSPKGVLEELVGALQTRQAQFDEIVQAAQQARSEIDGLSATVQRVLQRIAQPGNGYYRAPPGANGCAQWSEALLHYLQRRPNTTADCPLPELFDACRKDEAWLTIGEFHDGLRRLRELERIELHPWTGPLHEIPEPAYGLLVGHEIAYYASLRGAHP